MSDTNERLSAVEQKLGSVATEVGGLRGEVGGLRGEVSELRGEVGGLRGDVGGLRAEVGGLKEEVHTLQVLGERNTTEIRMVAEVQGHHSRTLQEHGTMLETITRQLVPLADLHAFVKQFADNHEQRLQALEKHAGIT